MSDRHPTAINCHYRYGCHWPECACPARPHEYEPDIMLQGDCKVCGHTRESEDHHV